MDLVNYIAAVYMTIGALIAIWIIWPAAIMFSFLEILFFISLHMLAWPILLVVFIWMSIKYGSKKKD